MNILAIEYYFLNKLDQTTSTLTNYYSSTDYYQIDTTPTASTYLYVTLTIETSENGYH